MQGTVFNIQRFSLHDGPGIRTTVFLKGCNLSCAWCHNPESFSCEPQLEVDTVKCSSCGACMSACPAHVHEIDRETGVHRFSFEKCSLCGACVKACPIGAIKIIGEKMTPEEVMAVVRKDLPYYERSGGGITVSGGEATMQFSFLCELLTLCKQEGIHTCLETNGVLSKERLSSLCELVDLFLIDFKHYDTTQHQHYTGAPNEPVYESLSFLRERQKPAILRCPIIPGINDCDAHFAAIREIKRTHPNLLGAEVMPYHDIGAVKWKNIGKSYLMRDVVVPTKAQADAWRQEIEETFF